MKTSFTPGPWACAQSICDGGDVSFDIHQVDIDGESAPVSDVAYSKLFKTYVAEHLDVQKANAQLIAAAPELLSALIALYAVASVEKDKDYAAVTNAAAVIYKATGAAA